MSCKIPPYPSLRSRAPQGCNEIKREKRTQDQESDGNITHDTDRCSRTNPVSTIAVPLLTRRYENVLPPGPATACARLEKSSHPLVFPAPVGRADDRRQGAHMVINRIHLGPVVFAKTLAASIAARQAAPPTQPVRARAARRSTVSRSEWRPAPHASAAASWAWSVLRPQPIDRGDNVVEGFHQR